MQLTTDEFRAICDLLFSEREFWIPLAELTGRNPRTIKRWYAGDPMPTLPADFSEEVVSLAWAEIARAERVRAWLAALDSRDQGAGPLGEPQRAQDRK